MKNWILASALLLASACGTTTGASTTAEDAATTGDDLGVGTDATAADLGASEDSASTGTDAAADAGTDAAVSPDVTDNDAVLVPDGAEDVAAGTDAVSPGEDVVGVDSQVPDSGTADVTETPDTGVADAGITDTAQTPDAIADAGNPVDATVDAPDVGKPVEQGSSCDPNKTNQCGNLQTCKAGPDTKFYCFCPDGQAYQGGICAGDTSQVQSMCAYLSKDCSAEGYCYDVTTSTCTYLADHKLTHPACALLGTNKSVATCVSAITDKTSPYFTSAQCPLVQYWSNPSDFPIDCRCAGKLENLCKRPYTLGAAISFGDGPRMRNLASTVQAWNGVVVNGEWLLPVGWSTASKKSQTMIFGIDLKTGKRRYFSGTYDDPSNGYTTVAAGDPFVNVMDIKLGADGSLYAVGASSDIAAPKVWKIDPVTGDRTLLFDEATADPTTLCANGSTLPGKKVIQMVPEGWAMDASGNFYFAYINMPGRGVVKFGKDFAKCEFLTMVPDLNQSTTMKTAIGTGYDSIQFEMRAFEIIADKLYAVADTKLIEVDLATGARKLISNAKDIGGLGGGPINAEGLGDRWSKWDPYRNVLWTHGISGGNGAIAVDLTTGDRTTWPCWHPGMGILGGCGGTGTSLIPGYLSYGGMIIDPVEPHDLYFAHDLFSVVKYEVKTGNSYILSL